LEATTGPRRLAPPAAGRAAGGRGPERLDVHVDF